MDQTSSVGSSTVNDDLGSGGIGNNPEDKLHSRTRAWGREDLSEERG